MRRRYHGGVLLLAFATAGPGLLGCVPGAPTGPEAEGSNEGPEAPAPSPNPPPAVGSIMAGVSPSGDDVPDSVSVSLDGGDPERVSSSGSVSWSDLEPGDHLLQLGDVPSNCNAEGENPRVVAVESGRQTVTLFDVVCSRRLSEIGVRVTTTGDEQDPDGYRLEVEGDGVTLRMDVGREVDLTVPDLAPGSYRVQLRDVDKDCEVKDDDKLDVNVAAGERVEVEFRVECDGD
ncbi:MAG TPA: hypothetical protein VLA33_09630 [Gemmatimonadota bacterium]|nr:hypothetical protein [Gemmatimonadota bacterium]